MIRYSKELTLLGPVAGEALVSAVRQKHDLPSTLRLLENLKVDKLPPDEDPSVARFRVRIMGSGYCVKAKVTFTRDSNKAFVAITEELTPQNPVACPVYGHSYVHQLETAVDF